MFEEEQFEKTQKDLLKKLQGDQGFSFRYTSEVGEVERALPGTNQ